MKAGDRKVYVIDGDVVQYADKSGIDVAKSDKSIVVCDAETGKYEYTSPDQLICSSWTMVRRWQTTTMLL